MKKYVIVGTGGRAETFIYGITRLHSDTSCLAGMCDVNYGRMQYYAEKFPDKHGKVSLYSPDNFEKMLEETKPDYVIVTTPDWTHDFYIVKALNCGYNVITEKPLTIDTVRCQKIIDTVKKTKKQVIVTFNYRYSPVRAQLKEILLSGIIGKILNIDFHWVLDTRHGADYFRRWHRNKKNSGGLMVHKATHHFDLVNWWLGTIPEEVYAKGKREFYTPETAKVLGLSNRRERCKICPLIKKCKFSLDLKNNPNLNALYLQQEKYDGYYRDKCVFSDEIDIEDNMNVIVKYRNGVIMTYSLIAYSPWEGYLITFTGEKGRIEHKLIETVYISGDGSVPGELVKDSTTITIMPHFDKPYPVKIRESKGGHGGGDELLLNDLFGKEKLKKDPLKRSATYVEGAWSILTGCAANISMKTGKPVKVGKLVKGLDLPAYMK